MILDIIVTGIISGSIYAVLAVGFSLIFGVARIVNIAHTAFYMVAAYGIYFGTQRLGWHPFWCMILTVALVTLIGLLCYKAIADCHHSTGNGDARGDAAYL